MHLGRQRRQALRLLRHAQPVHLLPPPDRRHAARLPQQALPAGKRSGPSIHPESHRRGPLPTGRQPDGHQARQRPPLWIADGCLQSPASGPSSPRHRVRARRTSRSRFRRRDTRSARARLHPRRGGLLQPHRVRPRLRTRQTRPPSLRYRRRHHQPGQRLPPPLGPLAPQAETRRRRNPHRHPRKSRPPRGSDPASTPSARGGRGGRRWRCRRSGRELRGRRGLRRGRARC